MHFKWNLVGFYSVVRWVQIGKQESVVKYGIKLRTIGQTVKEKQRHAQQHKSKKCMWVWSIVFYGWLFEEIALVLNAIRMASANNLLFPQPNENIMKLGFFLFSTWKNIFFIFCICRLLLTFSPHCAYLSLASTLWRNQDVSFSMHQQFSFPAFVYQGFYKIANVLKMMHPLLECL